MATGWSLDHGAPGAEGNLLGDLTGELSFDEISPIVTQDNKRQKTAPAMCAKQANVLDLLDAFLPEAEPEGESSSMDAVTRRTESECSLELAIQLEMDLSQHEEALAEVEVAKALAKAASAKTKALQTKLAAKMLQGSGSGQSSGGASVRTKWYPQPESPPSSMKEGTPGRGSNDAVNSVVTPVRLDAKFLEAHASNHGTNPGFISGEPVLPVSGVIETKVERIEPEPSAHADSPAKLAYRLASEIASHNTQRDNVLFAAARAAAAEEVRAEAQAMAKEQATAAMQWAETLGMQAQQAVREQEAAAKAAAIAWAAEREAEANAVRQAAVAAAEAAQQREAAAHARAAELEAAFGNQTLHLRQEAIAHVEQEVERAKAQAEALRADEAVRLQAQAEAYRLELDAKAAAAAESIRYELEAKAQAAAESARREFEAKARELEARSLERDREAEKLRASVLEADRQRREEIAHLKKALEASKAEADAVRTRRAKEFCLDSDPGDDEPSWHDADDPGEPDEIPITYPNER